MTDAKSQTREQPPYTDREKAAAAAAYMAARLSGHRACSWDDAPEQVRDYWLSFMRVGLAAADAVSVHHAE